MKRFSRSLSLALALFAARLGSTARAADSTPAVLLPPMLVEESVSGVPWLYANVGGTEFLSRCSEGTTRDLVEAWLTKLQLVEALVPGEFLARMDVPAVFVLHSQDLQQTVSAEIQHELNERDRDDHGARKTDVNIAPSMRLADRDMHASIAYVDEVRFDGANLSVSPSHVRYLLNARVPELPEWMTEGIERTWRRADFVLNPITLGPLVWQNQNESDELDDDPSRPRALLPANELFATGISRATENRHPRHAQTRAAEQELFFRWAMVLSEATRAAFWKFAARAAEGPVTEEMFEACFGFDFAELRDRLSDYLPKAVVAEPSIDPGTLPDLPRFEVTRATPNQIARVRGEWERLAIGHVQRRLPQVLEPYIAQARRTLRRAYSAGDRDPRLLATMGLCEIDAGNPAGAREFLEPAVAGGVVRPRAYYELARLRFAELRRDAPDTKKFSATELAPIFQPLQRTLTQAPLLPEVFTLLGDAWARSTTAPSAPELVGLEKGARLFARHATVAYSIAHALAQHGRKTEAAAVLDACVGDVTDENTRTEIARLRAELPAAPRRE